MYDINFYQVEVVFPKNQKLHREQIGLKSFRSAVEWIIQKHVDCGLKNQIKIKRQNESLWVIFLMTGCGPKLAGHIFLQPLSFLDSPHSEPALPFTEEVYSLFPNVLEAPDGVFVLPKALIPCVEQMAASKPGFYVFNYQLHCVDCDKESESIGHRLVNAQGCCLEHQLRRDNLLKEVGE